MVAYADTGFLVSLYLKESTSVRARASIQAYAVPLPITPLGMLELRNALNLAVKWRRITTAERDTIWQDVEWRPERIRPPRPRLHFRCSGASS